ncbi:hypothetical protein ABIB35_000770 [Arthrobacter sp. UYP6]
MRTSASMRAPAVRAQPFCWTACLALLSLLAGSGPTWNINGPLTTGDATVCAVQPNHGTAAFGSVVENSSGSDLTIREVSLIDANNLELVASYLMPIDGIKSYVVGTGTTEPDEPDAKAAWKSMMRVGSTGLAAGQSANIVVTVDNGDSETGTSRALRIVYEHHNHTYVAISVNTLILADTRCL